MGLLGWWGFGGRAREMGGEGEGKEEGRGVRERVHRSGLCRGGRSLGLDGYFFLFGLLRR